MLPPRKRLAAAALAVGAVGAAFFLSQGKLLAAAIALLFAGQGLAQLFCSRC